MRVNFYNFSKRENSTKRPTGDGQAIDCQVKQSSNIDKPTLILTTGYISENYAYISAWSRYYFVTDITVETGGRIEIQLSCDVLATCKDYIANYTCFVERSASSYNDMFDDEYVSNTENIISTNRSVIPLPDPFDAKLGCYVLTVVSGGDNYSAGITDYIVNNATLGYIMQSLFSDYSFLSDEVVKSFFNPFQYIVQLKWLPIDINWFGDADDAKEIRYGWWDSGQKGIPASTGATIIIDPVTMPANAYSDFRAISPRFTSYSLYLPGYGEVNLPNEIAYHGINIELTIDVKTGEGRYKIVTHDKGEVFATYTTEIGVPMQISQMNPSLGSVVSGGLGLIQSALSGNIAGIGSNLLSSAKSIMSPGASVNGVAGNFYDISVNSSVDIACYNRGTGERATSVAGRPCYATKRLGTLSGFVKCGNASIDIPFYENEKSSVNGFLNSGFYME